MNTPGFDAAQARYDSMLPDDPYVFQCPVSGESSEDCDECDGQCEPDEGCNVCGAPEGRFCRCDDLYEQGREDRWLDD